MKKSSDLLLSMTNDELEKLKGKTISVSTKKGNIIKGTINGFRETDCAEPYCSITHFIFQNNEKVSLQDIESIEYE